MTRNGQKMRVLQKFQISWHEGHEGLEHESPDALF